MTFMTKHIFLLFCNVKLIIDYNLCSVMTSLKIFDIFNIVIVSDMGWGKHEWNILNTYRPYMNK